MTVTPASPNDRTRQWLQRIDAAQRTQGRAPAARLAVQALADGVEDASLFNLASSALYAEGRFFEAVELLERARALAPNDPHVLNSLGVCLKALGQFHAALRAYGEASTADPRLAAPHFNRGSLHEQLGDLIAARTAYEQAAALDPSYVEPIAGLAWLDARTGNSASGRQRGERALQLSPSNVLARLALASVELQQGKLSAASDMLSALARDSNLTPTNRSIALGLLGDLMDAEGKPADAFAAYQASNAGLRALNAARFEAPGIVSALDHAGRLIDWFATADPEPWKDAPAAAESAGNPIAHVFLVGFPRSGTTLLENVLAAHPHVVALEEKDCLEEATAAFLTSSEGLANLARIGSDEAARYRDSYWTSVRAYGVEPSGRVFIDKMPLSSVALPVIAKLFPNARILFAQRDPRDVVLSCFRRRFGMNPSMYQLLTPEGAADFYDAVMQLSERYRALLPLPQHIVRYESLVDDFEATARSACAFLGLDWNQDMLDFAARARSRGISTPSAAQVARGLNRDGRGVWRRYEREMAPVLPLLQPWVERLGYEP